MEAFETFEHEGFTIELHTDYDAANPFEDFEQAAELVGFQAFAQDFTCAKTLDESRFSSVAHAARYLTLIQGYLVAIPFQLSDYGSGGYRAMLTETEDERAAGFVCVSQQGIDLTGAPDPEQAAREDFEMFRMWIEGEVVGYVVHSSEGELIDSLWGIYDVDDARTEAREAVEHEAHERWVEDEPPDVAEVLANQGRDEA
jgi:hypothetical protein